MDRETATTLLPTLRAQRWAALSTLDADGPLASMVAYAVDAQSGALLLHLSQLAGHTRNILSDPRVSLIISEPDDGREDPQTLARISVQGTMIVLGRDTQEFAVARGLYQRRFPAAEQRFGFADFLLFRLEPRDVRVVGGFGKASTLSGDRFRQLLREG